MKTMDVCVCPICEAQRNYYAFDGKCHFCNTPLFITKIELPEVDSSSRLAAEEHLESRRTGVCQSSVL
jgi:hypothetical protein